jgi:hypothetical protein
MGMRREGGCLVYSYRHPLELSVLRDSFQV